MYALVQHSVNTDAQFIYWLPWLQLIGWKGFFLCKHITRCFYFTDTGKCIIHVIHIVLFIYNVCCTYTFIVDIYVHVYIIVHVAQSWKMNYQGTRCSDY